MNRPTYWMSCANAAAAVARMSVSRPSDRKPTPPVRWTEPNNSSSRSARSAPTAARRCRKGGSVFALGIFIGLVDRFPMGALLHKGLTLRAARQHGARYIPMLLERMASGELQTSHLATHIMKLDDGPRGYDLFTNKKDECLRAVFQPG